MNESFEVSAEFRDDKGKGASRRLRRTGKVPAVLYGGDAESRALVLDHKDLMRHLENEAFYSHVLKIQVGSVEQRAILKDIQRHPAKRLIMHVDFQRVIAGQKLRMNVPLHFIGEETAPGKKEGGIISHLVTDVEIVCTPEDLPEYLEVDVSEVELDESLKFSDIKLPDGVEFGGDLSQPILAISRPKKEEVEEEEGIDEAALPDADAPEGEPPATE